MISKFNTQLSSVIGLVATICLGATTKPHFEASSSTDTNKSGGHIYFNLVRHIYNRSSKVWVVSATNLHGKIDFSGIACGTDPSHSPDILDMVQPEGRPGQIEPRFHPTWVTIPYNLYVSSNGNIENGPYKIGPGCSVAIEFTTEAALSQGTFYLTDEKNISNTITYFAENECAYETSIDSKICTLDSPASGDIIITGDHF